MPTTGAPPAVAHHTVHSPHNHPGGGHPHRWRGPTLQQRMIRATTIAFFILLIPFLLFHYYLQSAPASSATSLNGAMTPSKVANQHAAIHPAPGRNSAGAQAGGGSAPTVLAATLQPGRIAFLEIGVLGEQAQPKLKDVEALWGHRVQPTAPSAAAADRQRAAAPPLQCEPWGGRDGSAAAAAAHRVDLVIATSFIEVSQAHEFRWNPVRPILQVLTGAAAQEGGAFSSHGLALQGYMAPSCNLCSVTIVTPTIIERPGSSSAVADDGPAGRRRGTPGRRASSAHPPVQPYTQSPDEIGRQAFLSDIGNTPPIAVDRDVCGTRERQIKFVNVAIPDASLHAWQQGVFTAIDEVVAGAGPTHAEAVRAQPQQQRGAAAAASSSSARHDSIIAYLQSGSPPEHGVDGWLRDIVPRAASANGDRRGASSFAASGRSGSHQSSNNHLGGGGGKSKMENQWAPLVGCPHTANWGHAEESARQMGENRQVQFAHFGYEVLHDEALMKPVWVPKYSGLSRHIEGGRDDDEKADAIGTNCFVTAMRTYTQLRHASRSIEPATSKKAKATAVTRAVSLFAALAGLDGAMHAMAAAAERAQLVVGLFSAAVRCDDMLPQLNFTDAMSASSVPEISRLFAENDPLMLRGCLIARHVQADLAEFAAHGAYLKEHGYNLLRRDADIVVKHRMQGARPPDAEVSRRMVIETEQAAAISMLPDAFGCFFRGGTGGAVEQCVAEKASDFRAVVLRLIDEGDSWAPDASRFQKADRSQLLPESYEAVQAYLRIKDPVDTAVMGGHLPKECLGCMCRPHAVSEEAPQQAQTAFSICKSMQPRLIRLLESDMSAVLDVYENALMNASEALVNATMLAPSALSSLSWARFVTAAHELQVPLIVRATAATVEREPPLFVVPGIIKPQKKLMYWQADLIDRQIHIGTSSNGPIVRTFEDAVRGKYVTTSARVQVATPCTCDARCWLNDNLVVGMAAFISTRTPTTPVCRCRFWDDYSMERLWSTYVQHFAAPYGVSTGKGDIALGYNANRPRDVLTLGKPRVVEVLIVDAEPQNPPGEVATVGGIDFTVVRVSCAFTRVSPAWVGPLNDDNKYNEIWASTRSCQQAMVASGVRADKIVVLPASVDTNFYHPKFGHMNKLPHPHWNRDRVGGRRSFDRDKEMPLRKHFKFFAHFRWGFAANWEGLFRAYFAAFTSADKVSLYVKATYFPPARPSGVGDDRDGGAMVAQVLQIAAKMGIKNAKALPHFEIYVDEPVAPDMHGFYRATDAFVSASRGEPWGLETAQALAMAKPTIMPRCGAMAEYGADDAAMLVSVTMKKMPTAVAKAYDVPAGTQWCEPNHDELVDALKRMHAMAPEARATLGAQARRRMIENFSTKVIGRRAAERVREIEAMVRKIWYAGLAPVGDEN